LGDEALVSAGLASAVVLATGIATAMTVQTRMKDARSEARRGFVTEGIGNSRRINVILHYIVVV
jgi:hypothetical protein